ncbi:hypothetical protein FJY68_10615 [candidate division WOR-3 bacterium]|uniref:Uncharacterized protein n=1 Tax=candidate division WOR-3 bacterium TaxID=2052148 RepID=A0A938BUS1_UNCW3|nr:hypothetical protein [candidate division WOR-3 bacterium]
MAVVLLVVSAVLLVVGATATGSLSQQLAMRGVLQRYLADPWPLRMTAQTPSGPRESEGILIYALLLARLMRQSAGYVIGACAGALFWPGLLFLGVSLIWRYLLKRRRWATFILCSSLGLLAWGALRFSAFVAYKANDRLLDQIQLLNPSVLSDLQPDPAGSSERAVLSHLGDVTEAVGVDGQRIAVGAASVDTYGQYAELKVLIDAFANQVQCDAESMDSEIGRLDLAGLMSPENFGSASVLTSGRRRLRKAMEIADKYDALADRRLAELESAVTTMKIPAETKRDLLAGIRENVAARANTRMRFTIQRRIFASSDSLLAFLLARQGSYSISSDRVVFESDVDVATYNRLSDAVLSCISDDSLFDAKLRSDAAANAAKYRSLGRRQ